MRTAWSVPAEICAITFHSLERKKEKKEIHKFLSWVSHWLTPNYYICIRAGLSKDFPQQEIVKILQSPSLV